MSWPDYTLWNGESHPAVGDVDGDPGLDIVLGLGVYPGPRRGEPALLG